MTTQQSSAIPVWTVGDRLGKALAHAGVGVQEMADYLGVSRNTISNYLHGRVRPDKRTLMLWAFRTGVDRVWIESGEGDSVIGRHRSSGWLPDMRAVPPPRHAEHDRLMRLAARASPFAA